MTARAKGLSERQVLYGHVFRNAMLIVIAGFPALFVSVFFGGSIIIETIFSLDGLGQLGFKSAVERDYPVIFGTLFAFVLVSAGVIILRRTRPDLPRGFRVPFPTDTVTVNVSALEKRFTAGTVVDFDALVKSGLVDKGATRIKVLGDGDLTVKLSLKVHAISAGARAKVEAVGGTVELLGGPEA
jgi:ribosomal protein L15